jgi:hypothetical protein
VPEMTMRWRSMAAVVVGLITLASAPVNADRTKLLEVDLKTGRRKNIEGKRPSTRADQDLDALLDSSTGGAAFSTKTLEKIDAALRRFLRSARPRAMPRLLLFLYPGRISPGRLKELREVLVDVDLIVDPCGRTVCKDSVAKHIELLGRSIRQAVLRTSRYTVRFKTVTISTSQRRRGGDVEVYRFSADEVVKSGRKSGGGSKLVNRVSKAKAGYTRQMTKDVARRVKRRRVRLSQPPMVQRIGKRVRVDMRIKSDRNRYRDQVLGALIGAAEALSKSPLTPSESRFVVVASVRFRKVEKRTYSCEGAPLGLHLRGRMSKSQIWNSYVVEKKKIKGARTMSFSDEEASGGVGARDNSPDRTSEILGENFNKLAPCLQAEAGRKRRFRGVTLKFAVSGRGQAIQLGFKERRVSGKLKSCVAAALKRIRFQRHGGAPRKVIYPMYIQR